MLREVKEHSFYDDKFNSEIVVVDLGACRGEFINEIDKLYKVKKAILVEANPTNFKVLSARENYVLYNKAISDKDGEIFDFAEDVNSPYNGSFVFNYFNGIIHKIETISLEKIIEENNLSHIDLLKIDIEGAEFKVLPNLEKKVYDKISQISVEFHDFIDPSYKQLTTSIVNYIESFGFKRISKPISYMNGSEHYDVLFYK
jgi:FkbM family methyltransferase